LSVEFNSIGPSKLKVPEPSICALTAALVASTKRRFGVEVLPKASIYQAVALSVALPKLT
jgi:hypothetical protein